MADQPPNNRRITERLTVAQAAARLGITESAVRGRINRGTLAAEREDGAVYVRLTAEQSLDNERSTTDYLGESNALTSALEARIESLERQREHLERQLEQANERDRENRRLLAAALERIPPQLEPPAESSSAAPGDTEAADEPQGRGDPRPATEGSREMATETRSREPWWRRLFGR